MPEFWISNGFVVIYDGNQLMRLEKVRDGESA